MQSHHRVAYLIVGTEHDVSFAGTALLILVLVLGVRIIKVTIDGLGIHNSRIRKSRLRE